MAQACEATTSSPLGGRCHAPYVRTCGRPWGHGGWRGAQPRVRLEPGPAATRGKGHPVRLHAAKHSKQAHSVGT